MGKTHQLDGTRLSDTYDNRVAADVSFEDGQFGFKWTARPFRGLEGREGYRALRIVDKQYMVAVQIAETGTCATFVYHFRERCMYAPVLFNPGTEEELAMLEAAVINRLELKEQQ